MSRVKVEGERKFVDYWVISRELIKLQNPKAHGWMVPTPFQEGTSHPSTLDTYQKWEVHVDPHPAQVERFGSTRHFSSLQDPEQERPETIRHGKSDTEPQQLLLRSYFPLYYIYRHCQPLNFNYSEAIFNRRKSLVSKGLRFAGRPPLALNRLVVRTYV